MSLHSQNSQSEPIAPSLHQWEDPGALCRKDWPSALPDREMPNQAAHLQMRSLLVLALLASAAVAAPLNRPDHGFRADFPGKPEQKSGNDPLGPATSWSQASPGQWSYSVTDIRLKDPTRAAAAIQQAESGLPHSAHWTDLKVDGFSARQFEIPGPDAANLGLLVAHKGSLYQVLAFHPDRARAAGFLKSFHFVQPK